MSCNQKNCTEKAMYRYTWPGKDEVGACEQHAAWVRELAKCMGLHLQIIPLEPEAAKTKGE